VNSVSYNSTLNVRSSTMMALYNTVLHDRFRFASCYMWWLFSTVTWH